MLELKFIRENTKKVKENIKKKGKDFLLPLVDELISLDEEYRKGIILANDLKHQRNSVTENIALNKQKGLPVDDLLEKARQLPEKIKVIDDNQKELFEKIIDIQKKIPNIISKKTPIGKDDTENKEIKRFQYEIEELEDKWKYSYPILDNSIVGQFIKMLSGKK